MKALRRPSLLSQRAVIRMVDASINTGVALMDGEVVGELYWDEKGHLGGYSSVCGGKRVGVEVEMAPFPVSSELISFVYGVESGRYEGIAAHLNSEGHPVAASVFRRGTGVDIFASAEDGDTPYVSEYREMRDGYLDGLTRWGWMAAPSWEVHLRQNENHGIERRWSLEGVLEPGFPKFFILGREVSRSQYLRRAAIDSTLQAYRSIDDVCARTAPAAADAAIRLARQLRAEGWNVMDYLRERLAGIPGWCE